MRRAEAGRPDPLGLTLVPDGANVAVFSAHATRIELCLFDDTGTRETERIALPERTGDVHHGFVPGIVADMRYGLRAHGPYAPNEGHRFNPDKLLVDPYVRALDRPFALHDSMLGQHADGSRNDADSGPYVPKGIAVSALAPQPVKRPQVPWNSTVLYEMHVRGFTKQHPDVPLAIRGTCAALAHPAALEHLARLGVTTVELMPVAAAVDEPHLLRAGLTNYWGYNTIGWLVPDPRLAPGGIGELRDCVHALHGVGIEVLLDVVLNHSGEGDALGPTLSLRGLDNATYYRTIPGEAHAYINDTGCGNTLALDRAPVLQLALDTLRYYAEVAGVDGFRFDLATTLGRRDHGFDAHAPLIVAIEADPVLRDLKLIAEPWDIGPGGYQAGAFPDAWGEWNDRYRDAVRRFWRGDGGLAGALATRVAGSADLFAAGSRSPSRSVNFITAHDGFTLADLVAYERKHNEANGEQNRDGTDSNYSWNHGVEGESGDPQVTGARRRDLRALLATLLLSRGTPMLSMGDELGRTQRGNNNAYAQDNALAWIDWAHVDAELLSFTAALTALRRQHSALRADRWLSGQPVAATGVRDVEWRRADGEPMTAGDWESGATHTLVALLHETTAGAGERVAVALHAGAADTVLRLPRARAGFYWECVLDSARPGSAATQPERVADDSLGLSARSVALIVERPVPPASRQPVLPRSAGILLHPTSLPGPSGIGELGPEAYRFLDFLVESGMTLWQMLPLGPTGYGDSPYQCFSAFAGNPLLIYVADAAGPAREFPAHSVDFAHVIAHKKAVLRGATATLVPDDDAYRAFVHAESEWLEDYALFMALKEAHGGVSWTAWEPGAARRDPAALADWRTRLVDAIEHHRREQYLFFSQFHALKRAAAARGIRLMGDLPIYVAHDSADVWANPSLFKLDGRGHPTVQAGVPPDYFSATGQLWGNPIYDWDAMRVQGYAWWIARMRAAFALFDVVRIDHFRGFEAFWEVPGADTTAINGRWVPGPGAALFTAITDALGALPIVAENLGIITADVEALREQFGYPGMSILQFAFGANDDGTPNEALPHHFPRDRVVYTGTHDNDTTIGWWSSTGADNSTRNDTAITREREFAKRYLNTDGHEMHWTLMRAAIASVANTALIPLQDVLGLGSEARMNLPGRPAGNWGFRFSWEQITPAITRRLRELVTLYDR